MKIRYWITIDDIVAFNRFHNENSPTARRNRWLLTILVPGVAMAAASPALFELYENIKDTPGLVAVAIVIIAPFLFAGTVAWAVLLRWWLAIFNQRVVRRMLAEGSNRTMIGWREMELIDGRLVIKTELIHSIVDLRAIERIASNDEFTFIYIASVQAYLIPTNRHPDDEYDEFVARLIDAWENRDEWLPEQAPAETGIKELP